VMDTEKQLVEYIARALVDEPDKVNVTQIDGEQSTIIELRVSSEDVGKIIGKQGRVANAIRTLLNTACMRHSKRRVVLEIID